MLSYLTFVLTMNLAFMFTLPMWRNLFAVLFALLFGLSLRLLFSLRVRLLVRFSVRLDFANLFAVLLTLDFAGERTTLFAWFFTNYLLFFCFLWRFVIFHEHLWSFNGSNLLSHYLIFRLINVMNVIMVITVLTHSDWLDLSVLVYEFVDLTFRVISTNPLNFIGFRERLSRFIGLFMALAWLVFLFFCCFFHGFAKQSLRWFFCRNI